LTIRTVTPEDYFPTENLTREAFWDLYKPGCDEHLALNQLRKCASYIPELDLVAFLDDILVGHIICTRAKVTGEDQSEHEVLCLGPVSVMPAYQDRGIGSGLIRQSISIAREMGFNGIILYGSPAYYPRFGFRDAAGFGITTKEGTNFDPFMALELVPGRMAGIRGKFYEDNAFWTTAEDLEEFEKKFPARQKFRTTSMFEMK
jgi:predicted N-acetyltransferase YhbS